jgi:hypothetical protein
VRMLSPVAATLLIAILASNASPAAAQPSTAQPAGAAAAAAAAASAAAKAAAVPAGSALVHVSGCTPRHTNPQGGPGFIDYAPGNPGNGYFPDSYGSTYYQPPSNTSGPQLMISYTNISHKAMHSIQFGLLSDEILAGEVQDVGTFEPGVLVKHKLGLNLSAMIPGSSRCVPLKITFADGTTWRNPRLPKKGNSFNSKIPPKPISQ